MSNMESTRDWLRRAVVKYQEPDRVFKDAEAVLLSYNTLIPKLDTYTNETGQPQTLLCLYGTIPVSYRGATYNIPIAVWIPLTYPRHPPMPLVTPTSTMVVRMSKHVDLQGKVYHPMLANWHTQPNERSLSQLILTMQSIFAAEPPVYARPAGTPQQSSSNPSLASSSIPIPNKPNSLPVQTPAYLVGGSNRPPLSSSQQSSTSSPPQNRARMSFSPPTNPTGYPHQHQHPYQPQQKQQQQYQPPAIPVKPIGAQYGQPGTTMSPTPNLPPPTRSGTGTPNMAPPFSNAPTPPPIPAKPSTSPPPAMSRNAYGTTPSSSTTASTQSSYNPQQAPANIPLPVQPIQQQTPPAVDPRESKAHALRLQLLSKLKAAESSTQSKLHSDLSHVSQLSQILKDGESRLSEVIQRLQDEQSRVVRNNEILQSKTQEVRAAVDKLLNEPEVKVDDIFTGGTVVHNQLLESMAEESALDDMLYRLGQALYAEHIDLNVFLKPISSSTPSSSSASVSKTNGVIKKKNKQSTLTTKAVVKTVVPAIARKKKAPAKRKREEFEFPEDPEAWLPSDHDDDDSVHDDDSRESEVAAQTKKAAKNNKKKAKRFDDEDDGIPPPDEDELPFNSLKWKQVQTPSMFLSTADNGGPGGFYCLEELDGVDVEVVEGLGGGKLVKFKKAKGYKPAKSGDEEKDVLDHPADPEAPLPPEETDKYINIDEFDEKKIVVKADNKKEAEKTKSAPAKEKPQKKKDDNKATKAPQPETSEEAQTTRTPIPTSEDPEPSKTLPLWYPYRLRKPILKALADSGFETPTEIQKLTLKTALNTTRKGMGASSGRDIIGAAATGSGKTLAFGIPVVQEIAIRDEEMLKSGEFKDLEEIKRRTRGCTALILTPTRELAMQVTDHLKAVSKYTSAKVVSVVGGISIQKQERVLSQSPDIVVATPGRLWELISKDETLVQSFRCAKYLILDEADRMLEGGHFKEMESILKAISLKVSNTDEESNKHHTDPLYTLPTSRQTFVFSATLIQDDSLSKKLTSTKPDKGKPSSLDTFQKLLKRLDMQFPVHISCLNNTYLASGLSEARIECLNEEKDAYLYYLLVRYTGRTVVFANSIDAVRRLDPVLRMMGVNSFALHAEMQQRQRMKNLDRFRESTTGVLIASDVAARGLDIPSVDHVVHYQLPRSADLYVHRSGRTARAMKEGMSVMLCGPAEVGVYKKICHALGKTEGLPEFPVDRSILAAIRSRLNLATKIEAEEHKMKKQRVEKDWLKKAAEDAEMILSDDSDVDSDNDGVSKGSKKPQSKEEEKARAKLAQMKAELQTLLKKPLVPKGVNLKYLTANADTEIPTRILESSGTGTLLPTENISTAVKDVKAGSKLHKNKKVKISH
ncbi:ATP-dependent RNA helicase ddx24 [Chytridiales sp. JEL 0842]|nr:ATP-dependent RNA helicase ddx24 [Chytridiales sp. JEL 0842]